MSLVRTEGVILRSVNYSESSKILTLLSPAEGRVSVIAKGARRPKSPFRASTEPLMHVVAVYSDKATREVQTLTQCDVLDAFDGLKHDLTALAVGSYVTEVAGAIAQPRHAAPALYTALCTTLTLLDRVPDHAPGILLWGVRRVLDAAGLGPQVERCLVCGKPPAGEPRYFNPRAGGVTCRACHQAGSRPLRQSGYDALHAAGEAEPQTGVSPAAVASAVNALNEHVVFHMDHPCKSFSFLSDRLAPAAVPPA